MPANLVARRRRTSSRPLALVPHGDEPRGISSTGSSEKRSMTASRSWRLKASSSAVNVSTVATDFVSILVTLRAWPFSLEVLAYRDRLGVARAGAVALGEQVPARHRVGLDADPRDPGPPEVQRQRLDPDRHAGRGLDQQRGIVPGRQ